MLKIAIATASVLFVSSASLAQIAAPPNADWQNAVIAALQQQRNAAEDQVASLAAQLQVAKKEIDALKAASRKPRGTHPH